MEKHRKSILPRSNKNKQNLYLDQVFGFEDKLLKSIKEITQREKVISMQISPHEGRLLYFLAKSIKADKIVEIGSLYSYSTIHLVRSLNSNKGLVFTCDISKERHQTSQTLIKNYPEYEKIKWVTGKALDTLPQLEKEGPFDMVFIDADKENYVKYLEWAEKNLRSNGLLVADNTFLFGSVYGDPERKINQKTVDVMHKFNQYIAQSPLWIGTLIPTTEGLTIAIKKS